MAVRAALAGIECKLISKVDIGERQNSPSHGILQTRPSLFADHYRYFIAPRLSEQLDHWDNLSDDIVLSGETFFDLPPFISVNFAIFAYQSHDNCLHACRQIERCIQYVYEPMKCRLGESVSLGRSVEPILTEGGMPRIISGWILEKIDRFVKEAEGENGCDENAIWDQLSPEKKMIEHRL